jgi:hypothetical protein
VGVNGECRMAIAKCRMGEKIAGNEEAACFMELFRVGIC